MSNFVYCSDCGTKLTITRKAMPKFGRIIDIINPHVCLDTPIEPDLTPLPSPIQYTGDKKFVQKLNELQPLSRFAELDEKGLGDRRFSILPKGVEVESDIKSTAPSSLLKNMGRLPNITPTHNLTEADMFKEDKENTAEEEDAY
jgi:hypothetical protein